MERPREPNGGTRPVPDPTILTSVAVDRAVAALREPLEARIHALDETVREIQGRIGERHEQIVQEVAHLQKLHEEKFNSVHTQFKERDVRVEQSSLCFKEATDAAFQSAKEIANAQNQSSGMAIAKNEAATTKQIDAIANLISGANKAMDGIVDDIKGRLTLIEGRTSGSKENWSGIVVVVGLVFGLIGTAISVITLIVLFTRK